MTCHFKRTMKLFDAMQRAQRFNSTTLDAVVDPNGDHHRKRLDVTFLSCKPAKKSTFQYQSRQNNFAKRKLIECNYDRFLLFKVVNAPEVVGMFTKSDVETGVVLQYWKDIRPGVTVSILNPKFEGYFQTSNNVLISTINPLVVCAVVQHVDIFPPTVLSAQTNDYFGFSFNTNDIRFENIVLRSDLCPGVLCDGQVGLKNQQCGCVSTESRNIPVLEATVINEILNGLDHQFENVLFRSRVITRLFAANASSIDLRSDDYDEMLFEDTVIEIVNLIRAGRGVKITGWVKPSQQQDAEKAAVELKRIHVVAIETIDAPTEEMNAARYTMVANVPLTRAATMVGGHATNLPVPENLVPENPVPENPVPEDGAGGAGGQ